ncbi:iron chelate uptake ABC transporter family permease subunit [Streptomyces sp. NBC_01597]|uniref:iron chelate uptake ABC transporter family permease subunit n=1 Tax=Streptomyces sp. NBC_01597 TaxID=2975891 RepID=UPI003869C760
MRAGGVLGPLGLDPDTAAALGVRMNRVRLGLIALGVVLAATATEAARPISFVALTAHHLAHGSPVRTNCRCSKPH